MMRKLKIFVVGLVVASIAFVSCENEENDTSADGKGKINVLLTDAPYPIDLISNTYVTVDEIEIRQTTELDTEEDSTSFTVIAEGEMEFDLLELTNGITEQIASADLEAGSYDMIRLHVVDATVVLNDGTEYELKVPSGYTSGIKVKIDPEITIEAGQTSDVLLDFDVSRSFVLKGSLQNINGFNFKPVVRGVYMGAAGRIEGTVTDTTGAVIEDAMIKAWMPEETDDSDEDFDYISSFTDVVGEYKIIGLKEGTYTVVCEVDGLGSDTLYNIPVTAGESVEVDFELK